jgi:hypothetical protein
MDQLSQNQKLAVTFVVAFMVISGLVYYTEPAYVVEQNDDGTTSFKKKESIGGIFIISLIVTGLFYYYLKNKEGSAGPMSMRMRMHHY